MSESNAWIARGWVGLADVIAPFKASIDAVALDNIGGVNPPKGMPPSATDTTGALVGFVVMVRPSFEITVPEGAHEMARPVAEALLAVLVA
jgi:hypothetical protein